MPLNLGLSATSARTESQEASREARRFLANNIRSDWEYPPLPSAYTAALSTGKAEEQAGAGAVEERTTGRVQAATEHSAQSAAVPFEPVAWREAEYSSNESHTSDHDDVDLMDIVGRSANRRDRDHGSKVNSMEEGMNSPATTKPMSKKRKWQAMLEQELSWNTGLAHFTAQRNAWTCAKVEGNETECGAPHHPQRQSDDTASISSASKSTTSHSSRATATSSSSSAPNSFPTSSSPSTRTAVASPPVYATRILLPVAPPLLPDHPVRTRIGPASYGEIYTKVILQARTPTVPVNLAHIVGALIHGWKEEGNWPPKPAPPEPSMRRKVGDKGNGRTNGADDGGGGGVANASSKHPHLKRGVKAVGRALGFAGVGHGHGHGHGVGGHFGGGPPKDA